LSESHPEDRGHTIFCIPGPGKAQRTGSARVVSAQQGTMEVTGCGRRQRAVWLRARVGGRVGVVAAESAERRG
jgi:hypothetical protein